MNHDASRRWPTRWLSVLPLAALGCSSPKPLPGGPPPEFEPPRALSLPGVDHAPGTEAEAPPPPGPAPLPSLEPPPAPSASAAVAPASSGPSTWTTTDVTNAPTTAGAGDPIPPDGRIGAKHLLVMYVGARRAGEAITRTKEEAKAHAEACLQKARAPGASFDAVVKECTDEPFGKERGGDLFTFPPAVMAPEFSKGVLDTKVGQLSPVVETPFGFHVILRTR